MSIANTTPKLGIMQSYFFPYIGYFQLIDSVDIFVLYEHVNFQKRSWITRNRILDKGNGKPKYINLTISKKDNTKTIGETKLMTDTNWKEKIDKLIYYNYKKAPYFDALYPLIQSCIYTEHNSLHQYNSEILKKISTALDIQTKIVTENPYALKIEEELSNSSDLVSECKSERIYKICKHYQSDQYINPIGGVDLYCKNEFQSNGIKLSFINTKPYNYDQFNHESISHLSIIDVLMHNGIEKTKQIITNYNLI